MSLYLFFLIGKHTILARQRSKCHQLTLICGCTFCEKLSSPCRVHSLANQNYGWCIILTSRVGWRLDGAARLQHCMAKIIANLAPTSGVQQNSQSMRWDTSNSSEGIRPVLHSDAQRLTVMHRISSNCHEQRRRRS